MCSPSKATNNPPGTAVRESNTIGAVTTAVHETYVDELAALATGAGLEPTFAGLTVNNDRDLEKKTSLLVR